MRSYLNHRGLLLRASLLGAGWLGFGCSNILGISEPMPLEASAGGSGSGAGGETTGPAGTHAGGDESSGTGAAGMRSGSAGEGAEGGQAGSGFLGEAGVGGEGGEAGRVTCVEAATQCSGNELQRCRRGAWVDDQACPAYCLGGACIMPPSCAQLGNRTCGNNVNCCQSLEVPGGNFIRDYDNDTHTSTHFTATVSSFLMDRFEVSVGRLAAFVNAYDQLKLRAGDGKSPGVSGDVGWQEDYPLPSDSDELKVQLNCPDTSWRDGQDGDLNLAANCVSFYVAYAFCIWDQARLPTEAEWNYAAAGGDEQREYPWSTTANSELDEDHAYYGQDSGLPIEVGLKPQGNGRWGQSDLSGNVDEWTLDYFVPTYPSTECDNCVNAVAEPTRSIRGGAFRFTALTQKVTYRTADLPEKFRSYTGFRCVRDLPLTQPK